MALSEFPTESHDDSDEDYSSVTNLNEEKYNDVNVITKAESNLEWDEELWLV